MTTPATVLDVLTTDNPHQPRLTCYDDARGERIELSGAVLANWAAKAANALQEEFDVEPGSVVALDLPTGHWRTAYWAVAVWAVGATLSLDVHEGADVLVTTAPTSDAADDSDEVVAVTLPALARTWQGEDLPTGVLDEAAEISGFGDDFSPWYESSAEDPALVRAGDRWTMAEAVPTVEPGRVLLAVADPAEHLRTLVGLWAAGGSAVTVITPEGTLPTGLTPDPLPARLVQEGVTRVVETPPGQ